MKLEQRPLLKKNNLMLQSLRWNKVTEAIS